MTHQLTPTNVSSAGVSEGSTPQQVEAQKAIVTIRIQRSHLLLVVGIFAGFIAGVFFTKTVLPDSGATSIAAAPAVADPAEPQPGARVDVSIDGAPFRGPADADVTIVEFTDYQCPFCKRHHDEVMTPLLAKHKDVKYVVRNMPLAEIHPEATKAAEAAMCVLDQDDDSFWTYRSTLFASQEELGVADLKRYANDLDIDQKDFEGCLDDGQMAGRVAGDVTDGQSYGVTGTPTFFVNGEPIKGAVPLNALEAAIERNR